VTGHSLGGALATLFAFNAAAAPDSMIPKPVSVFSFASPYVGDESFRSAHILLERLGKLRHMRVSNHRDIITTVPKMSFSLRILHRKSYGGSLFKHVGINLQLFDESPCAIIFPRVRTGSVSALYEETARGLRQCLLANIHLNPTNYGKCHSLREYSERIQLNKDCLKNVYLNVLYSTTDIVGKLVPQF